MNGKNAIKDQKSGRLRAYDTLRLERDEGQLALMGCALALIDLVEERITVACNQHAGHALLSPAIEDLSRARDLVRRAQSTGKQ